MNETDTGNSALLVLLLVLLEYETITQFLAHTLQVVVVVVMKLAIVQQVRTNSKVFLSEKLETTA